MTESATSTVPRCIPGHGNMSGHVATNLLPNYSSAVSLPYVWCQSSFTLGFTATLATSTRIISTVVTIPSFVSIVAIIFSTSSSLHDQMYLTLHCLIAWVYSTQMNSS